MSVDKHERPSIPALRRMMFVRGLTPTTLAQATGLTTVAVANTLTGRRPTRMGTIRKIADVLARTPVDPTLSELAGPPE